MTHDVDAIYQQGVFRPVGPLALPEGTRVHLRVEPEQVVEIASQQPVTLRSPRLAHPEQIVDFQMEVSDIESAP